MKTLKLYLMLSIAGFMLTIYSCSKDAVDPTEGSNETSSLRKGEGTGYFQNGILNFETVEDAQAYLITLEEEYEAAEDQRSFLIAEMAKNSGETLLEDKWGANLELFDNEEMDQNGLEEYNQVNWFKDELKMLMLNKDYELGVGQDIVVWYSPKQSFTFPKSNENLRSLFQIHPKNQDKLPTSIIIEGPTPVESGIDNFFSKAEPPVELPPEDPQADPRSIEYFLVASTENLECEALEKQIYAYVEEYEITSNGGEPLGTVPASFVIDFGDNTSETVGTTAELDITHEYPNFGVYTMTITATFINIEGNTQTIDLEYQIHVNGACSEESNSEQFAVNNSTRQMTGYLVFKKDLLGAKWKANTTGWKWKNNKWKKEKGALKVQGWGTFRDDDCNVSETKNGSASCSKCKSKCVSRRAGLFQYKRLIGSDDVRSYHKASFSNGSVFEIELVLDPC